MHKRLLTTTSFVRCFPGSPERVGHLRISSNPSPLISGAYRRSSPLISSSQQQPWKAAFCTRRSLPVFRSADGTFPAPFATTTRTTTSSSTSATSTASDTTYTAPPSTPPSTTATTATTTTTTTTAATTTSDTDSGHPAQIQIQKSLLIAFTCNVCSTRNHKYMSKRAYTEGLVLIQCQGCSNRHLIADHLGWTDHGKRVDIEQILAAKGESVKRIGYVDRQDGGVDDGDDGAGVTTLGETTRSDTPPANKDLNASKRAAVLEAFKMDESCLEVLPEELLKWEHDRMERSKRKQK